MATSDDGFWKVKLPDAQEPAVEYEVPAEARRGVLFRASDWCFGIMPRMTGELLRMAIATAEVDQVNKRQQELAAVYNPFTTPLEGFDDTKTGGVVVRQIQLDPQLDKSRMRVEKGEMSKFYSLTTFVGLEAQPFVFRPLEDPQGENILVCFRGVERIISHFNKRMNAGERHLVSEKTFAYTEVELSPHGATDPFYGFTIELPSWMPASSDVDISVNHERPAGAVYSGPLGIERGATTSVRIMVSYEIAFFRAHGENRIGGLSKLKGDIIDVYDANFYHIMPSAPLPQESVVKSSFYSFTNNKPIVNKSRRGKKSPRSPRTLNRPLDKAFREPQPDGFWVSISVPSLLHKDVESTAGDSMPLNAELQLVVPPKISVKTLTIVLSFMVAARTVVQDQGCETPLFAFEVPGRWNEGDHRILVPLPTQDFLRTHDAIQTDDGDRELAIPECYEAFDHTSRLKVTAHVNFNRGPHAIASVLTRVRRCKKSDILPPSQKDVPLELLWSVRK